MVRFFLSSDTLFLHFTLISNILISFVPPAFSSFTKEGSHLRLYVFFSCTSISFVYVTFLYYFVFLFFWYALCFPRFFLFSFFERHSILIFSMQANLDMSASYFASLRCLRFVPCALAGMSTIDFSPLCMNTYFFSFILLSSFFFFHQHRHDDQSGGTEEQ